MNGWSPQLQALIDRHGADKVASVAKVHLAAMRKYYPSKVYVPNRGQWRAAMVCDRDHLPFHLAFLAGNGVGKTNFLVNLLIGMIWGKKFLNPDWLGKLKIWDKLPKNPRIRLVCHADDMKEGGSLYDEILEWFPKGHYSITKESKQYYSVIRCDNGVTISVRTHDQDVTAHAGPNLDIILANEPLPQQLYGENCGRLRKAPIPLFWFFMTPLSVSAWLFEQMVEGADDYDTVTVEASIWDNCREIPGTRGVLPKANIEQLIEQWRREDPDQAEARITGQFQHLSGRIFKTWMPEVHVVDDFEIPENWACSIAVDPHDSKPPAIGFFAQDPLGNLYVIGEYPNRPYVKMKDTGQTYDHHVEATLAKKRALAKDFQWSDNVMDPNKGNTKVGNTSMTIQKEYANRGLRCRVDVDDDLDLGHKRIQTLLYFDKERYISDGTLAEDNHPRLFVFRSCKNVQNALAKYGYKSEGQGTARSLTSKVDQSYKDFVDVVRYRAVSIRAYANPKKKGTDGSLAVRMRRARKT